MPTPRATFIRLAALLVVGILCTTRLSAVIVSYTLTGVTTFNLIEAGQLNTNVPVGSAWTAVVEWDTAASTLSSTETQAQYRLTSMSFTLHGNAGDWTTGVVAGDYAPGFTNNYTFSGTRDEMQFTSGWGPASHTNQTLYEWQPYSINLVLTDLTGTAIPSLTPAPTFLDLSDWSTGTSNTYMKLYLNNNANRYILGNIQSISVTGSAIPEPSTYAALAGAAALGLALWRRRRSADPVAG